MQRCCERLLNYDVERRELQNHVNMRIYRLPISTSSIFLNICIIVARYHMWEIMTLIIKNKFFPYSDDTNRLCIFMRLELRKYANYVLNTEK